MTKTIQVHIGTPEDMGQRFVEAWQRAEQSQAVSETHVTFCDLKTMLAVLTPKRLDLLKYIRHNEVQNINVLAINLHRDYRNVYNDVKELTKFGLVSRTSEKVFAPYAEIDAKFVL